jgi:hypothetical protein
VNATNKRNAINKKNAPIILCVRSSFHNSLATTFSTVSGFILAGSGVLFFFFLELEAMV